MDGAEIRKRFEALQSQRKNLDDTLQAIEKYVVPYRGDFFKPQSSELEVEWRRRHIYDSTAPISADLLASQIHSNLTSPSIRWFELRFRKDEINDRVEAQQWLSETESQIWRTLLESDFNMEIAETYLDLVSFGTAILFEEELSEERWEGITFTTLPIKHSYFEFGADDVLLRVYRRLKYTKLQLQDRFPDYDFQNMPDGDSNVDEKYDVIYCVYNRPDVDQEPEGKVVPDKRPFGYKYVLAKDSETLEEGGYYEMPAFVARWKKVSGSVWGHSPAFVALSDILQLNEVVAQTSEARAKAIDPPYITTERGILSDLDMGPGGLTMVMSMEELAPLIPHARFDQADAEIDRLQQSVRSTFFIDKLELKESPAMTATEVMVRYERMQRTFAPTLGRLSADLLDRLIEMTYRVLERNGRLPEIPENLQEEELEIEYTGPIARAQKNEQAQGISLWAGELAGLAQMMPDILDVVDTDKMARELALDRGVPAKVLRDEATVNEMRSARKQQEAQMQELAMAQQTGDAITALGEGGQAMGEIAGEG